MNERTVRHDESHAEQSTADDIAQPMNAAYGSADDHESGESDHCNDNGISDRFVFEAIIYLNDCSRHDTNDEHGR